jgi:uncharacterized NAD-dependent epimerase/dehydratase family protein
MRSMPHFPVVDLPTCIEANLQAARLTNPNVRCIGVSINTAGLSEQEGRKFCEKVSADIGLPAVDPLRDGVSALVDNI